MVVKLKKDLIRDIKRGHPWVYEGALEPHSLGSACFAKLVDRKGQFIAWGVLDPKSALRFRIVSFEKAPFTETHWAKRFDAVLERKRSFISKTNTGLRLLNGEGDGFPGLICDLFGDVAVLQTDGMELDQVWNLSWWAALLKERFDLKAVVFKSQRSKNSDAQVLVGELSSQTVLFLENGIQFEADVFKGQKTGFFLDQRNNRDLIRKFSKGKSVLNLFSYTGGFSVAAGLGGATHVESVDLSPHAIDSCARHWAVNGLDSQSHKGHAQDCFEFLKQSQGSYDLVVVDPPSFASSRTHLENALESYAQLFSQSAQKVSRDGLLALSSCSSHVTFEMFYDIAVEAVSRARRRGRVISILGQPEDHPFPLACPELRYLKFFLIELN